MILFSRHNKNVVYSLQLAFARVPPFFSYAISFTFFFCPYDNECYLSAVNSIPTDEKGEDWT